MKKQLLFLGAILTGSLTFGQFTEANQPQVGDGTTLYLIDSTAANYEGINGAGSTWDYSDYGGYNEARLLDVFDASTTIEGANYPEATFAVAIENFLVNYLSSTEEGRISHGFVFSEPDLGDILAIFDQTATVVSYPFALGDDVTDNFSGTLESGAGGGDLDGTLTASVDGTGTLMLANGVTHENVIRYKLSETVNAEVDLGFLPLPVTLIRTQFEYYKLDDSRLPLLIHAEVDVQTGGIFDQAFNVVYSTENPTNPVSTNEVSLESSKVFPNPASDKLNISFDAEQNGTVATLHDATGRVVLTQTINGTFSTLNVADFNKGVYLLNLSNGVNSETKRIVIR